jgi:flagellar L-ring protein precursor FlgH
MRTRAPLYIAAFATLLAGCASPEPIDDWSATLPPAPLPANPVADNGAVYRDDTAIALFADVKARRVGDTLTVRLVERTSAQTSSSTTTARDSNTEITNPTLLGDPITDSGLPVLDNSLQSQNSFAGEADSEQSNSMSGSLSVTVYRRLPNGNLMVRGEKWIRINQGKEFLRVAGIVRPADIGEDNSVPSFKLADARIDYRGKGALADSNRPGWLTRFFQSPIFPF